MKRRRLIAAFGTAVAGGSAVLGSGAFTSVSAERSVSVAVADDDRAFLRLEPIVDEGVDGDSDGDPESTGRSFSNGRVVQFDIPGDEDGENPNAKGVAPDSVYEYHDLLQVVNQGTKSVTVASEYNGASFANLALVTDDGVLRQDPPTLDVGDGIRVGLLIDTHGTALGTYDETLTIVADQP